MPALLALVLAYVVGLAYGLACPYLHRVPGAVRRMARAAQLRYHRGSGPATYRPAYAGCVQPHASGRTAQWRLPTVVGACAVRVL